MYYLVTRYIIDNWSIVHFLFFAALFKLLCFRFVDIKQVIIWAIFLGYLWEFAEISLENMCIARYTEPWLNRYIFDIIFDTAGAVTGFVYGIYRTILENIFKKQQTPKT